MRSIMRNLARTITIAMMAFAVGRGASAHPGSGIVVDGKGQVYFCHTGICTWKIDTDGQLVRHEGPGNHWLELDAEGNFVGQRWPRYREQMSSGLIRYGDAEIQTVGTSPTLLRATSFPIAIGRDGALYYPDVGTEERVHIKRLAPSGQPTDFATLPLAMEIAPNNKPWKALWIHGLAAGPDGNLYYTEKEAVRRIDAEGNVSLVAEKIKVSDCVHSEGHRGGPILRGLAVADDGTIYVAAMGCQAVIRVTQTGEIDVVLRSEDSWTPTGIAISGGDVYVLEFWFAEPEQVQSWLPRVRKLSPDGSVSVLATVTDVPES